MLTSDNQLFYIHHGDAYFAILTPALKKKIIRPLSIIYKRCRPKTSPPISSYIDSCNYLTKLKDSLPHTLSNYLKKNIRSTLFSLPTKVLGDRICFICHLTKKKHKKKRIHRIEQVKRNKEIPQQTSPYKLQIARIRCAMLSQQVRRIT